MSHIAKHADRREFLRRAAALSSLGAASPFAINLAALGAASAQTTDYKALVCVFLYGGNDSFNMVLPTDTASWDAYVAVRNQAPDPIQLLAAGMAPDPNAAAGSPLRLGGVLPITPADAQGRSFALHPMLGAVRDLFAAGRLAIVPNVGPLVEPLTKANFNSARKPAKLYSHNDQQSTWQAFAPEGARVGWGGKLGDLMASANSNTMFTSISTSGSAVWLAGQRVLQYQVTSNGAIRLGGSGATLFGSTVAMDTLRNTIARSSRSPHLMAQDQAAVTARSIDAETLVSANLPAPGTAPWGTPAANYSQNNDPLLRYTNPLTGAQAGNGLAQQFQAVARMMAARAALGAGRQVFMVSLGGFDTHDGQNRSHADLYARLGHALAYFDKTIADMGLASSVTTFTASDFGRTFTSNGDGTDHGWGSHHFVMGGAVKGGALYGPFPVLGVKNANNNNFDSSPDQLGNGALLPTTSVDQYGATLAQWFGVSDSTALATVFPNLSNFGSRNLGFMV
jgi:uncharacterized protein (DUF1501 family)